MSIESEFAQVRAMTFEPYSLFRVRPMRGSYVNVSEAGFRENAAPLRWPPEAGSIFVFGGSTAFGYGVADGETIPAQMEKLLGAPVYNFATPNYTSVQERIRFEQLLLDGHRPRTAVFLDGFSDFIAPYYQPLMFASFADALSPRGPFARLRRRNHSPELRVPDPVQVLDRYVANANMIRSVAGAFSVRPLFVWQPVPCYEFAGPAEDHGDSAPLIECVQRGYTMMSRRKQEIGDFVWLADMQRGRTDALYVDPDHYNAAFSRDIAGKIAEHLRS